MSRVGKAPIAILPTVEPKWEGDKIILTKKDQAISLIVPQYLSVKIEDNFIKVELEELDQKHKKNWGSFRTQLSNAVEGLASPFTRKLLLVGVGYKAQVTNLAGVVIGSGKSGDIISLSLGYSHDIKYLIPTGIEVDYDKNSNSLLIKGTDKKMVSDVAASIRALRKVEPYKGKGIRYEDEIVILKKEKGKK